MFFQQMKVTALVAHKVLKKWKSRYFVFKTSYPCLCYLGETALLLMKYLSKFKSPIIFYNNAVSQNGNFNFYIANNNNNNINSPWDVNISFLCIIKKFKKSLKVIHCFILCAFSFHFTQREICAQEQPSHFQEKYFRDPDDSVT